MLQVVLKNNSERYSVAELAQMAIEGGCRWLRLQLPGCSDDFIQEQAEMIVPLCKEAGVMLSIDDRPDLAKALGLHGVHLTDKQFNPIAVREELGAEAVIGVTTGEVSVAEAMKKADIDYVELPADFNDDSIAAFMVDFREIEKHYPVVAYCRNVAIVAPTLALGVSGIVMSEGITEAADPVAAVTAVLRSND